jgi:hypothetical protein
VFIRPLVESGERFSHHAELGLAVSLETSAPPCRNTRVTKWSETPPALRRLGKVCRSSYSEKYGTPARRKVLLQTFLSLPMYGWLPRGLSLGKRFINAETHGMASAPVALIN